MRAFIRLKRLCMASLINTQLLVLVSTPLLPCLCQVAQFQDADLSHHCDRRPRPLRISLYRLRLS
jgi:hypothetical protein